MKQVILIRADLQLGKGKAVAQGANAAVDAVLKSKKDDVSEWRKTGMAKIALKVADEKELHKYVQLAKDSKLVTAIITDAGKTVVEPGTVTAAAIGPAEDDAIDAIVSDLKLL